METILVAMFGSFVLFLVCSAGAFLYWKSSQGKQDLLQGQSKLVELLAEYTREIKLLKQSTESIQSTFAAVDKIPPTIQALTAQVLVFNATVKQMVKTITRPERPEEVLSNPTEGDKAAFFEISKLMLEKQISFDQASVEYQNQMMSGSQVNPSAFGME